MKYKNIIIVTLVALVLTTLSTDAVHAAGAGCSILPISCDGSSKSSIIDLLKMILKIMTGGVGVIAVGAIIYASVLYTSAGDNAQQVTQSKTVITNTAIGVVAYGLMALILNFLIPGGVFG